MSQTDLDALPSCNADPSVCYGTTPAETDGEITSTNAGSTIGTSGTTV